MQEYPTPETPRTTPFARVFSALGKTFSVTGYSLLGVLLLAVIGYNYVMRPDFLQPRIVEEFAKATHGRLELKLEQASLFRGFRIRNIAVHPPEGYSATPIFKADEINILYNVFGFFRGSFGVHEILLRNPEVFIEQRNNVFNVQALPKPSEKKEKPEEEKEPADRKPGSDVISWFFNAHLFAHLALENLNFTLDATDKSNKVKRYAHLKNFHFRFSLLTRNFSSVNKADPAKLVQLLNAFVIELNPQKKIQLAYEGPEARVRTDLDMFWLLFYDGATEQPEFISRMRIGQDKIPVALGKGRTQNLAFVSEHAIDYDARADKLDISAFAVRFMGDTLLSLTGNGERLLKKDRRIAIATGESRVNLGKLYEVNAQLLGKRDPYFSGFFSIKPTKVNISGNTIDDSGGVKLDRVQVRQGKLSLSIPSLDLDHAAFVDSTLGPLPVRQASAKMRGNFNGAGIALDASLAEDKKTAVSFSLRGLDLTPFAAGAAAGTISTTFSATGPSPQDLAIAFRLFSPQLFYYVDRGKSGINRIDLNIRGIVKSSENFKQNSINLPVINLSNKDKEYGAAVDLKSRAQIEKADAIRVTYNLDGLTVAFKELVNTMPAALQESLSGLLKSLKPGKSLRADGETSVSIGGGVTQVEHLTQLALPDVHVDDIRIKAKARLAPPMTYLDQFSITGLRQALQVSASGNLRDGSETVQDEKTGKQLRVQTKVPDIRFKAELSRKEESEILDDMFLVGSFLLVGHAQGNIVDGKVQIDNLGFRNPQSRVQKVNLLFPFKHDLKLKKTLNLRAGNKERIIKNYNFNRPYNFSIENIEIPDPNKKGEWLKLVYARGNYPAVGASMEYKDNVFVMPVLQMYTLNGVVTISDTLFNLGRLRPSEMEYSTTIQIKDIDLKPLMVKEKADTITDGKLRIDILLTGNRLDKPVENLNGYLSIFRIGPEFAEAVMKAVKPKQSDIINTIATNTAIPKKINIELRDGFVYSDIPIKKGAVGALLFSPDEINNRRINIPEFFQRISTEASTYTSPAANPGN